MLPHSRSRWTPWPLCHTWLCAVAGGAQAEWCDASGPAAGSSGPEHERADDYAFASCEKRVFVAGRRLTALCFCPENTVRKTLYELVLLLPLLSVSFLLLFVLLSCSCLCDCDCCCFCFLVFTIESEGVPDTNTCTLAQSKLGAAAAATTKSPIVRTFRGRDLLLLSSCQFCSLCFEGI